ncbi:DWD (DDB1-binding WD40 protein) hypersensitive to ABA 1 [Wolffia australiana]
MGKTMGDLREWDEEEYRNSILRQREQSAKTVFRAVLSPPWAAKSDAIVVASSDGSVSPYSISSCIAAAYPRQGISRNAKDRESVPALENASEQLLVQPLRLNRAHAGPAYDIKFYGRGEDSLLLSCGDDGRICGWRWKDFLDQDQTLSTIFNLVNPQSSGPWGALSPIPETNSIATNAQQGSIFSAAGDGNAYCWDMETEKVRVTFKGHKDYLHCVAARSSCNQIITGSEDGTTRIWDCRTGKCTQLIYPGKGATSKVPSWVSCIAVDTSESWMVCGTGSNLSVWSLPSFECIWSIDSSFPLQDVSFHESQILAVGSSSALTRYNIGGKVISQIHCAPKSAFSVSSHSSGLVAVAGYGGLVDVISEFSSHLCAFRC